MKVMRNISLLLFVLVMIMVSSCGQKQKTSDMDKPVVNVSILPLKYFARELDGSFIRVNVMVPKGSSPTTYEPTPKQMSLLARSDAYLGIKPLIFEKTWMQRFKTANADMKVFDLSEDIDLINRKKGNKRKKVADPHIWMSPKTALQMVENMKDALTELYPERKKSILKNYKSLVGKINEKDRLLEKKAKQTDDTTFLIFHPSLGYLARDYGFEQLIIQHQGKEPSSRRMKNIIIRAKSRNVSDVFVQKQFDTRNAQTIAEELGVDVKVINPLTENWANGIDEIAHAFED